MAEESDASEPSPDDEPEGAAPADEAGERVDSEVEPQVEGEVDPEVADDEGSDAEASDAEAPADASDVEEATDDEDPSGVGDAGDAEDATGADDEPIGAVTDASAPPAESAPGVADEGDEGTAADRDVAEPMPVDADAADGEVDPADVNHGAPPDAVGEGPLQPAQEPGPTEASEAARHADESPVEPEPADAAGGGEPADAAEPAVGPASEAGEVYPEGPPDDQEMPLADHIEEMVLRLSVVCAVATVVAGTVFFFEPLAENMIMFLWNGVIPWESPVPETVAGTAHPVHFVGEQVVSTNPRVYGPLELKLAELKFSSLVGFVLALPVFVYETYRFMRPGLYPHERRYYLAAVPTSLVLAFVGVSFAYFVILPAIFAYFIRYSRAAGALAFALRQTFDLILVLMGYMALVFQIPLLIMLAIMIGVTDRQWLEDRRLYFWGGFLGVAFLFVPEPTGMAPILVALTMIGLFEGTLALLRWTGN